MQDKEYVAEFNRPRNDNIRLCAAELQRWGLVVTRLPHLTTLLIKRPAYMSWRDFKAAIRSVLQPRLGSVVIASRRTGRIFICSNRGNQAGLFQRVV